MRDLVEFAYLIGLRAGSPSAGVALAIRIQDEGAKVLGDVTDDDETAFLIRKARNVGLLNAADQPNFVRCAELIVVCDILAGVPEPSPLAPPGPRLVFTTPDNAELVEPRERLDLLVVDVIRMATREIMVGGPYWNEEGFDKLLEVLTPAVEARNVRCTFYVHTPSDFDREQQLRGWIASVHATRPPSVRWYCGPRGSLMNAKFVVADRVRGYFGTANLTSLGLGHHVEIGIELGPRQSEELCDFIEGLDKSRLFTDNAPKSAERAMGN